MQNTTRCPYSPIQGIKEDHPGFGSCRTCTGGETCHDRFTEPFKPVPPMTWEARATFEYAPTVWREELPIHKDGTSRWWITVYAGGHEFVASCNEKPSDLKLDSEGFLAEQYAKKQAMMDVIADISRHLTAAVSVPYGYEGMSKTMTILRTKSRFGNWG